MEGREKKGECRHPNTTQNGKQKGGRTSVMEGGGKSLGTTHEKDQVTFFSEREGAPKGYQPALKL